MCCAPISPIVDWNRFVPLFWQSIKQSGFQEEGRVHAKETKNASNFNLSILSIYCHNRNIFWHHHTHRTPTKLNATELQVTRKLYFCYAKLNLIQAFLGILRFYFSIFKITNGCWFCWFQLQTTKNYYSGSLAKRNNLAVFGFWDFVTCFLVTIQCKSFTLNLTRNPTTKFASWEWSVERMVLNIFTTEYIALRVFLKRKTNCLWIEHRILNTSWIFSSLVDLLIFIPRVNDTYEIRSMCSIEQCMTKRIFEDDQKSQSLEITSFAKLSSLYIPTHTLTTKWLQQANRHLGWFNEHYQKISTRNIENQTLLHNSPM